METLRWIPSKSANPLGHTEATPSQSSRHGVALAGVESGRRGPNSSANRLPQGRGALQTPNAR